MLQCDGCVFCLLQCVAVCCSVLQCVAVLMPILAGKASWQAVVPLHIRAFTICSVSQRGVV